MHFLVCVLAAAARLLLCNFLWQQNDAAAQFPGRKNSCIICCIFVLFFMYFVLSA